MINGTDNKNVLACDLERILFSEDDLDIIVGKVADQITQRYSDKVLKDNERLIILAVLNGSFQFVSDLVKKIDLPLQVEFMFASSYGKNTESSGDVNVSIGKNPEVLDDPNANIVVIEDIVDSGNTLSKLMDVLSKRNNRSVALCALFDKPERRKVDVKVDFLGARVPDEFIVGYGLDYNEKYRNLPYVGILKREIYEH